VRRTSLLLDACIVINLTATNRLHPVAQAFGYTFTVVQQAAAEVGYLRDTSEKDVVLTPIDLTRYESESLEVISLSPAEYPRYVELATDDRKARRLCAGLQLTEPMRTLGILHAYADATHLPHAELRDLLVKIRDRASFQPPRSDPDRKWWEVIIDD
jgi:hypothetical protein